MAKFDDVRMKGFATRTDVRDVWQLLQSRVGPLPPEPVLSVLGAGRVLAESVMAPVSVPGFARAAMDGYAVRAVDTFGAEVTNPIPFSIVGESLPGVPPKAIVSPKTAVRVMTGAPLPSGADTVVPAEVAEEHQGQRVDVLEASTPGRHVSQIGEDVREGAVVLAQGRRLRPQDVGLLSAIGVATVLVYRQPRVEILGTGNELLPPGEKPTGVNIVDSNSPMLAALATRDGAETVTVTRVRDEVDAIRDAMQHSPADVVLVSGGSSVGVEDHAPRVLAELGTLNVHGVNLRPASPMGIGFLTGKPVFLLPGNPVSCLCGYDLFAGPVLRLLQGRPFQLGYAQRVGVLSQKIVSNLGRLDYVRIRRTPNGIEPIAISGASILTSTVTADGFVLVEPESEGHNEGQTVTVYGYDSSS